MLKVKQYFILFYFIIQIIFALNKRTTFTFDGKDFFQGREVCDKKYLKMVSELLLYMLFFSFYLIIDFLE